jgi:MoaA/NifB/PqqE/SkfB family radical SAM enzyme
MKPEFVLHIDVIDACNLKCPSCPRAVVNGRNLNNLMELETLDRIITKAKSEFDIELVYLYNWAEPFLHPQFPEMIRIVKSHGVPCGISSNLNINRNLEQVISANPDNFVLSVSGFNQSVYSRTHKGGNIETVKKNMIRLAELKKEKNSSTRIEVNYIRYLGNLDDMILMRKFADSLGFAFRQTIAALFPLEKLLVYLAGSEEIEKQDKDLLEILAFPYNELLRASRYFKKFPCSYRESQVALNWKGDVQLCCLVFDQAKYTITNYLSSPIAEIQKLKQGHETCKECQARGIHTLGLRFSPHLKPAVLHKFADYYAEGGVDFSQLSESSAHLVLNQSIRLLKEQLRHTPQLRLLSERIAHTFPRLSKKLNTILFP